MAMQRSFDEIDVSTLAFWQLGAEERDARLAMLRAERPVSWQRPAEGMATLPGREDPGYWAVLRHADVLTVSRDPETYSSAKGFQIEDVPEEILESAGSLLGDDHHPPPQVPPLVAVALAAPPAPGLAEASDTPR